MSQESQPEPRAAHARAPGITLVTRGTTLWLFALAAAAVALVWGTESGLGQLTASDRWAYPLLIAWFLGLIALVWRNRRRLVPNDPGSGSGRLRSTRCSGRTLGSSPRAGPDLLRRLCRARGGAALRDPRPEAPADHLPLRDGLPAYGEVSFEESVARQLERRAYWALRDRGNVAGGETARRR